MKSTRFLTLASLGILMTACATQSPAPVVSGISRMPWEPKLRPVKTPIAVQQQVATLQAVPSSGMSEQELNAIEPAAGPVTYQKYSKHCNKCGSDASYGSATNNGDLRCE